MKIGRGLSFYWDTCIFLHWLSDPVKDRAVVDGIEDIVKMSERGDATIFTSTITRIEVLRSRLSDDAAEAFVKLFPRAVEWVNVDPRIAALAHDIRNFYSEPGKREMGTPDCIHLATAIIYEADEMNTLDGSGKKRRHDLIPLSGDVMGGKYKIVIRKPVRMSGPPPPESPTPPLFRLLATSENADANAGSDEQGISADSGRGDGKSAELGTTGDSEDVTPQTKPPEPER
jgi:predicted nucleic acid-binding protein